MKCGICKAEMEAKMVSYTEDREQGVVVVRHVPAHVCTECGNVWYTGTVIAQLEKLLDALESTPNTEVSIINFAKPAA